MSTLSVAPNVEEIAAPLMLGVLWNWTLYGVLIVQLYVYSYNFPGDRTFLKLLVYSVFLVETLQTALTGADLYYWFVSGFGNQDRLASPYMSDFDVPVISSIVSFTVQLFFVYRIWVLSGRSRSSWFLCLSICLCSTIDTVAAIYLGVSTHVHQEFPSGFKPAALTWLSGNTLSDILIASSMIFYLKRERNHFNDHALSKIVRLTIETNVLTTTVGIVSLLMVAFFPHKTWFACPTTILGKLYSNTLLVSLNNRISIRDGHGAVAGSPGVTFALTTGFQPTLEIGQEELKPSGARPSEDSAGQDTSRVFDIA